VFSFICLSLVAAQVAPPTLSALSQNDLDAIYGNWAYYDGSNDSCPTVPVEADSEAGLSTRDYSGKEILNEGQVKKIQKFSNVYQEAAKEADIPWQMLAVVHLKESGLGKNNPSNGQGVYQFVSKQGGPYPEGEIDDKEFLRQTILAAKFLKSKANANYSQNRDLSPDSSPEVIKDTFFSYNGRASVYEQQAKKLGFEYGYDGSPYVMNKADAKRDPNTNPSGWGQIKRDFGAIEYPANQGYGTFVVYASLAGLSSGSCTTQGTVRSKVVQLVQKELALWESGGLKPGTDFKKYTGGAQGNWCAWFVSWVYNQAGYPLDSSPEGRVPAVVTVKSIGEKGDKFKFHAVPGYTPKPGDIAVYLGGGISHVNLVVGVKGKIVTVIGGNQGGGGSGFTASKVTQYDLSSPNAGGAVGYVSPD